MASTANDILEQVLKIGGFIQDGKMSSGLINAEISKTNATTDLRYRHLFNVPGKSGTVIDLVYEVPSQSSDIPGTPSIYFKLIEEPEPSPETIKNLRSLIWNQGHAPTLWLVTPTIIAARGPLASATGMNCRPSADGSWHILMKCGRMCL